MRSLLLIAVVAGAIALAPRAAHACGQGGTYGNYSGLIALGAVAIVVGSADAVMGLYDVGSILTGSPASAGYGTAETLIAIPQVALGAIAIGSSTGGTRTFFTAYTAWTALMAGHGLWTIATARPHFEEPDPPPPPTPDHLSISFGPTYVPLTNQPMPAFGLTGRF